MGGCEVRLDPGDVDVAVTASWAATCKDCRTKSAAPAKAGKPARKKGPTLERESFDYSDDWATRTLERGGSRSDRCPECRRTHSQQIRAFPVAYVDIRAIGQAAAADPLVGPTGPLGGLGPLPNIHERTSSTVALRELKLGLTGKDILELIEKMAENQVVILEAGTGTGKSTLAPFRLMNPPKGAVYRPTDFGPIIVTEPRIPATTEVAKFVGEKMCFGHDPAKCTDHVGPGYPVGYQCDGKKVWDDACRLIYVTDGTMINWIKNGDLARFSTVIIDEAHERSENIDTILALLHQYLPRYRHLKVVIASATIDKSLFEDYFADVAKVGHHFAKAKGKPFSYGTPLFAGPPFATRGEVDALLADGLKISNPEDPDGDPLIKFSGWSATKSPDTDQRDLRKDTESLLDLRLRWQSEIDDKKMPDACAEQSFRLVEAIVAGTIPPGDILVFLPTKNTVLDAMAAFEKKVEDKKWPVSACWLMKATPEADKKRALAACEKGTYKVVFASNLAETSLTIAGIRYVVDSGLICQAQWDPRIAASSYPVDKHSQSGVRQRWGRVGRKTYGWVFPLYSIEQFTRMPRDTPAGSTQTSLEQMYMKLAAAGVDDLDTVKLPADFATVNYERDRDGNISAENFRTESTRARRALIANGAMTSDNHLTSLGRELERSRLSPERTMALLFADRLACVPEVALALVALDAGALIGPDRLLRSSKRWPGAWCVQAHRCHQVLALGCEDDLDLVLRIFSDWETAPDPSAWARSWWVDEEALDVIKQQTNKLIDDLAPGMSKQASRPLDLSLTSRARAVLSRALTSTHYQRRPDGLWDPADRDGGGEPVALSPHHLIDPSNRVLALNRERPYRQGGDAVASPAVIHGVVNVLPWACKGPDEIEGPDPFTLMIRARRELRRADGTLDAPADPLQWIRSSFPVGTMLTARLKRDRSRTTLLAAARTIATPFTPPDDIPTRPGDRPKTRAPRTAKDVYSGRGSVNGRETTGDFRGRKKRAAGAEDAPEEIALQPRAITDLEPEEFGAVAIAVQPYVPASVLDESDELTVDVRVHGYGPIDLPITEEFTAQVVGYAQPDDGTVLVLQPLHQVVASRTDPAVHPDLPIGKDVQVLAGELITNGSGSYRVLHRCDEDGEPDGRGDFFFHGPALDEYDTGAATGIVEGSRWTAKVLAWTRASEPQSISLLGVMYERFVEGLGLRYGNAGEVKESAHVTGSVVEGPVVVKDSHYLVVDLDVPSTGGFRPRMLVPVSKQGEPLPVGIRVSLNIAPKLRARRSGRWEPQQLERLLETNPGLIRSKGEVFELASNAPLGDDGLDALLAVDPTDSAIASQVSRLWQTSRLFEAANDPRLRPTSREPLRPSPFDEYKEQHSPGEVVSGTVSQVSDMAVVVDLGEEVDGEVFISQMSHEHVVSLAGYAASGDEIEAKIIGFDEEWSRVKLSVRALLPDPLDKFKQAHQAGDVVTGTVRDLITDRAFVDLGGGVQGSVHRREVSHHEVRNIADFVAVGDEIEAKIIDFDEDRRKVNLSIKALLISPLEKFKAAHSIGDSVAGRVTEVTDSFVRLDLADGVKGLIRVGQISDEPVSDLKALVKRDAEMRAKILKFDEQRRQVELSVKALLPDPFTKFVGSTTIGSLIRGTVMSLQSYGAFVRVAPGLEGLLHVKEMANRFVKHPSEIVQAGQEVTVRLLSVDRDRKKLSLSLRNVSVPAPTSVSTPTVSKPAAPAVQRPWIPSTPPPNPKRKAQGEGSSEAEAVRSAAARLGLQPSQVVLTRRLREAKVSLFGRVKQTAAVEVTER